jgi:DNA-3-methyladenine glycosylase I
LTTVLGADGKLRCGWVGTDEEYMRYHDEEWGVPLHGDRALFEKMCLEGFQAGLSWITILRRRPAFRRAFHGFDIDRVAAMTPAEAEALMDDASIIRNRAKIHATISNARVARDLTHGDDGALDRLLWGFAPAARESRFETYADFPAITAESTAMSKSLKKLGFRFVGPTTMYALMQSAGMVDDHLAACWRAA